MTKAASFESAMEELEKITKLLENGETTLDDAIKYFEKGIEIAGECHKILDKAEQKVVKIFKTREGEVAETPFDDEV
jgi:exodeoxyribonuclease VII small subunit